MSNSRILNVHFLPELIRPELLAGCDVVVIDVLRATTTIVYALAAGAREVWPCLEVDQALRLAAVSDRAVLGGERGGQKISGFDLGNSPEEYAPTAVAGKRLIFTTTNGTRAMEHCSQARRVFLAAFANYSAVCERLRPLPRVEIVCAGTNQEISREDVLLAGALAEGLTERGLVELNDQAILARDAWRKFLDGVAAGQQPLHESMRHSAGARNLIEIGQERDIEIAARIDRFDIVPELDLGQWVIR